MSLSRAMGQADVSKLKQIVSEGITVSREIEDLREGLKDTVAEKAKKLEQKSREHLGDKTTEAIKDTAKKVSTSAAQSVRDALIQSAADKAGDAVLGIGRWAIRKITGKNKK